MPLGQKWEDASYDYLFSFGTRTVTNNVVLVLMDDSAYSELKQSRDPDNPWDRSLHTQLANKLADDGCPLVVFDVFFLQARDSQKDAELASALKRLNKVALGAKPVKIEGNPVVWEMQMLITHPGLSQRQL